MSAFFIFTVHKAGKFGYTTEQKGEKLVAFQHNKKRKI